LLKKEKTLVEVKHTRNDLGNKEIKKQLLEDIAHYRKHPDCSFLFCFIYDPNNRIKNANGFIRDLSEKYNDFEVKIDINPK
jgi:hypothetical protein